MLLDFEEVDQEDLLKKVKCPVLIIHGDSDWEENLLSDITRRGMKWLPKESRLEIIEGAGHSFMNHLTIVESLSLYWLLGSI